MKSSHYLSLSIAYLLVMNSAFAVTDDVETMNKLEIKASKQPRTDQKPDITRKPSLLPISEETARTEQIGQTEIKASGATNVIDASSHRVGVDVQNECSVCNAKNISLNNMPGRFTTLMIDGIPLYSAASAVYGLEGIPVNVLDRIDLARGAAMSLVSPEAIAGSVNLVTKKITQNEGSVRAEVGEDGSRKLDYFQGWVGKEKGQFLAINGQVRQHDAVDQDGNGVSEFAGYGRQIVGVGVGLGAIAGWQTRLRMDHVDEKRTGGVGTISTNFNDIKSSTTGNPFNWAKGGSPYSDGWVIPDTGAKYTYNNGFSGMAELINTHRTQGTLISERTLGKDSYRIALGLADHQQDSFYEGVIYNAKQTQSYLEGRWKHLFNDSAFTAGVSYKSEQYQSTGFDAHGVNNSGIDNYNYSIPSLFGEYDFFALGGDLEVNLSARYDDHNVFGGIFSPRALVSYLHNDDWTSRFAVGKGYRVPTTFFEQDHGILDTDVIRRASNLTYETAYNAGYNLTYQTDKMTWSSGITWTEIDNMAKLDIDNVSRVTTLGNVSSPVGFTTLDTQWRYDLNWFWTVSVGGEYTHYDFKVSEEPFAFARPEWRGFVGADLNIGKWDWRTRATWTGSMDLAKFANYADNPRYSLDGSAKLNKSPAYWLIDTRVGYQVDKDWRFYAGIDNLLNEFQTESPLWLDKTGNIDVTQLWGLTHGRHIFMGVEYQF